MLARLFLLLTLLGVAAFAPAPFPRPPRRDADAISVPNFQGLWRIANLMHSSKDGNHRPFARQTSHVKVESKTLTFLVQQDGGAGTSYTITIDTSKRPAHLDFWNGEPHPGRPPGGGIIRKKGEAVEIIYVFGGNSRPVSFEQPPDGQYVLTLQRVR